MQRETNFTYRYKLYLSHGFCIFIRFWINFDPNDVNKNFFGDLGLAKFCAVKIYPSLITSIVQFCVKFGITNRQVMLLSVYDSRQNWRGAIHTFPCGLKFNDIYTCTAKRMIFRKYTTLCQGLGNTSHCTIFAIY